MISFTDGQGGRKFVSYFADRYYLNSANYPDCGDEYTSIPFSTGFETGLDEYWCT